MIAFLISLYYKVFIASIQKLYNFRFFKWKIYSLNKNFKKIQNWSFFIFTSLLHLLKGPFSQLCSTGNIYRFIALSTWRSMTFSYSLTPLVSVAHGVTDSKLYLKLVVTYLLLYSPSFVATFSNRISWVSMIKQGEILSNNQFSSVLIVLTHCYYVHHTFVNSRFVIC